MSIRVKQAARSFECREINGEFFVLENRGYKDLDGKFYPNYKVIARCPVRSYAQLLIKTMARAIYKEDR